MRMCRLTWMCAGLALATAQAGIVEETKSKPELVASVEIAPFAEIRRKLTSFGTLMNNPIVPMALVPPIQSAIEEALGKFCPDSAIAVRKYVYQPAWQIAVTSEVTYAVEDLTKMEVVYVKPPKGPNPLVRLEVNAAGLAALDDYVSQSAAEDRKARKAMGDAISGIDLYCRLLDENPAPSSEVDLRSYVRACFSFDLRERDGISVEFRMEPRPGAKVSPAAGFRLPPGAFDGVPDNAPAFLAVNDMLVGFCRDEREWKASSESAARIWTGLAEHALKDPGGQKFAVVLKGAARALADYIREMPFPDPSDWSAYALAFGPHGEPYFVLDGESAAARRMDAADVRFLDGLASAVEKQWPGRGLVRASAGLLTVDYAAVLDVAAAESQVKDADRELAHAKQRIAGILGSTTGELSVVPLSGRAHTAIYGPHGFHRPVSAKPTGEARLAAALPETVGDRPSCAALFSCYMLARDFVLPVAVNFLPKNSRGVYRGLVKALPGARWESAIAAAYWARPDGSHRYLLRVTADELKNYGAVFNVVYAARLLLPSKGDE